MTVNAINGSLTTALSAVDGVALSTLNAINGQALAPSGSPSAFTINFMAAAEHESSAILKWPLSGSVPFASGVTGAFGRVYDNAGAGDLNVVSLGGDFQLITVGFRVRIRTIPGTAGIIARFRNSTAEQISLRITNNASLRISKGIADLEATGASYLAIDTWYTFMWYCKIADAGGEWEVRVIPDGGATDTPLSGTGDTQAVAGVSTANEFLMGDATANTYTDEAWIETSGALVGYCRVETLAPSGAGGLTQLTRGGADSGANWSQVDDHPANGDTDYVQSSGSDQFDSYAFANRSVTGTPLAIQICVEAKFATAGTRQIKLGLRIGGTVYEGSITHTLTSAYAVYREVFNNNPATSNAWTDSEIDGAEVVIKCLHTDCRITNVAIEVLVQL